MSSEARLIAGQDPVAMIDDGAPIPGACPACPFNEGRNQDATEAQTHGCLPSEGEIRALYRDGEVWACHERPHRTCHGLRHHARTHGLPAPGRPTLGERGEIHHGD
ncbi:hypothetical protein J2T57_001487 [Natronocella acetinitrilica]|uniref:Uncharacterized protein n=1 Tax=Natronocella acetinitrilica TaxID=414046 RepID=A0AAE3G291_9GAMM|nr:hypothetical protein [Natronocella acetinitrilica]MCP1674385.1 hypothetical protein [Natronocella acetinitrilica]